MNKPKVAVFDADGVTVLAPEPFSRIYARQNGRNPDEMESFFAGPFQDALTGKRPIKDLINEYVDIWQGDPDQLMPKWCEAENYPNQELIELIVNQLKLQGIICALATNQETYRLKFVKEVMFPGVFDVVFASCEMHCLKPSAEFFATMIKSLHKYTSQTKEIIYFDDSLRNVAAANACGIKAVVYQSVEQVRRKLLE